MGPSTRDGPASWRQAARRWAVAAGGIALAVSFGGCSGGGGGNAEAPPPGGPSLALLAGNAGGEGSANGTGTAARFRNPTALAFDAAGNLFVADTGNFTIRRISPAGEVSTFAGQVGAAANLDGSGADATGSAARFGNVYAIASDAVGNLYLGDGHVVRRVTPGAVVTTIAGRWGHCGGIDWPPEMASFCFINGIATDGAGNILVSSGNTIRLISPSGSLRTLAGSFQQFGSVDGDPADARFNGTEGVATDPAGNLFVADYGNRTLRKVTPFGVVSTVAGSPGLSGSDDGVGPDARFNLPLGVGVDREGNVLVSDAGSSSTIRKVSPAGAVTTFAGVAGQPGSADGTGPAARFRIPRGIAVDALGHAYIADSQNHAIRRVTPSGSVSTFAGAAPVRGHADGTGTAAVFTKPWGIAADAAGNVFVADGGEVDYFHGSGTGTIRKISPAGEVTTLAGNAGQSAVVDGPGVLARFRSLSGLALDAAGNLYVGDSSCSLPPPKIPLPIYCGGVIRKVTPEGMVTTIAGRADSGGSSDGSGSEARFGVIEGLAVDASGNLVVAESGGVIRKVSPAGVVTTLAHVSGARGIAIDGASIVFANSNDGSIGRVSFTGQVTALVPAGTFRLPFGIVADGAGNYYVSDATDHTVRKVGATGVVTTVAGISGADTFDPGVLPAKLAGPRGLALSGRNLLVTLPDGVVVIRNVP